MDNEATGWDGWDEPLVLELDQLGPDPMSAEDFEASVQALIREYEQAWGQPASAADEVQHIVQIQQRRAALDAEEARALANFTR